MSRHPNLSIKVGLDALSNRVAGHAVFYDLADCVKKPNCSTCGGIVEFLNAMKAGADPLSLLFCLNNGVHTSHRILIKQMKESEKRALEYLVHRGFKSIVYEPDGNIPPDFLVEGRIAVEVRELYQYEGASGASDKGWLGLSQVVSKLHSSIGPPPAGVSWFVVYTYNQPLPNNKKEWEEPKRELIRALRSFTDSADPQPGMVCVSDRFEIKFIRARSVQPTFFVLGGICDGNTGYLVVTEMHRNIQICIDEKAGKIAKVRHMYPEWWLILEDHIGWGVLGDSDRSQLREVVRCGDDWTKVILVSPLDSTGFEI